MLSFRVKFVQTDRRTKVKQYAPDLAMWGHKNIVEKGETASHQQFLLFCHKNRHKKKLSPFTKQQNFGLV